MLSYCKIGLSLFSLFFLFVFLSSGALATDEVRKANWSGSFYPENRTQLVDLISSLSRKAQEKSIQIPAERELKAIIVPHAGYSFSGLTAAHMSLVLSERSYEKVVILGPDHRVGYKNAVICRAKSYKTPLGLVPLHQDAYNLFKDSGLFSSISVDQSVEHSIEVVLPFLQSYLHRFRIVPVVFGDVYFQKYVPYIKSLQGSSTLLVVSTDLSHYLEYSQAQKRDKQTIQMILDLEVDRLKGSSNRACGLVPLCIVLQLAKNNCWQPLLLNYSTSGDTSGPKDRVVGYATIAFFGESKMESINEQEKDLTVEQGQSLVALARHTIGHYLEVQGCKQKRQTLEDSLTDNIFKSKRGVFVTLKKDGQLRGCIGSLVASESIIEGVKENAVKAAFQDPRFPPLSPKEFDNIQIEISVLSEPAPLDYSKSQDLINKLRVNVDGVILKKGMSQATFLPQVWEQLPRPEEFLSHLCLKAGLSSDTWKKGNLEVLTYQVQNFEEE
ncbi:MAG TPA: AmmeMemoRadiSam system protein B [Desulfohalobiaceae bacterium]|nr:AmmeMemoRadiSam system protein B [Desulfohalobiaceae bacterium]